MDMTNYELMVVANTKADSETLSTNIKKVLREAKVANFKVDNLGRKALAYPIAKQQEAEYIVFNFEAPGDSISHINNALRLEQEAILRYLIVRQPEKASKVTKLSGVSGVPRAKVKEKAKAKVTVKTATGKKKATVVKTKSGKINR